MFLLKEPRVISTFSWWLQLKLFQCSSCPSTFKWPQFKGLSKNIKPHLSTDKPKAVNRFFFLLLKPCQGVFKVLNRRFWCLPQASSVDWIAVSTLPSALSLNTRLDLLQAPVTRFPFLTLRGIDLLCAAWTPLSVWWTCSLLKSLFMVVFRYIQWFGSTCLVKIITRYCLL